MLKLICVPILLPVIVVIIILTGCSTGEAESISVNNGGNTTIDQAAPEESANQQQSQSPPVNGEAELISVDNEGNTSIDRAALEESINRETAQPLTDNEKEGIIYMREEEKLARDVYSGLYEKWNTGIFNNIGSSEQTHMDAMESLIIKYGLTDPARDMDKGDFSDTKLQHLYDQLMVQGSNSEIDALKVGAAIEEIDILDIENYIVQTDKQDIITVYENL
ncbi:MAG: DUF2202 domain-containing protein [Dehalococcoidales bacterium]|nr:DUF2202 domain-containing protein [Dehalococcoidales bacterium]